MKRNSRKVQIKRWIIRTNLILTLCFFLSYSKIEIFIRIQARVILLSILMCKIERSVRKSSKTMKMTFNKILFKKIQ
jgi:hypothetical protein